MAVDPDRRTWFGDGERFVLDVVNGIEDDDLPGPSRLPGWTRAHVVGHLARNADALRNLLRWARTGEPSPMYTSAGERADGIERTARLGPQELRQDLADAAQRLVDDVEALPDHGWDEEVLTARGRAVPASEVLWMRARETWIHGVDLDAGASFVDAPTGFVAALLQELATAPSLTTVDPALHVRAIDLDRDWTLGTGELIDVSGPATSVLTWLSGRGDGSDLRTSHASGRPPAPPAWL